MLLPPPPSSFSTLPHSSTSSSLVEDAAGRRLEPGTPPIDPINERMMQSLRGRYLLGTLAVQLILSHQN